MTQELVSGDTALKFTSVLEKINDTGPWTLVGATIEFLIKRGTTVDVFPATLVDDTNKVVEYEVGVGFPEDIGEYLQVWRVTFPDGKRLTFPTTPNDFTINGDFDGAPGIGNFVITINTSDGVPIEGCNCWVTIDQAGNTVLTETNQTNSNGEVTFQLSPGTYWLFKSKTGVAFQTNPKEFTVV